MWRRGSGGSSRLPRAEWPTEHPGPASFALRSKAAGPSEAPNPGGATLRPPEQFYEELYAQELTHWWHVGKRERVLGLLERFRTGDGAPWRMLDVGCGTGGFLEALSRRGPAVGMDHEALALDCCRRRGQQALIQHDLGRYPWPMDDGAFDGATALDVVEHMDDDVGFVRELFRVIRPAGIAVISVPSFQWLWSYWDAGQGHRRRYTQPQLVGVMRQVGFRVVWSSYVECATLVGVAPARWWKQQQVRRGRAVASDNAPPPAWVNRLLLGYERLENQWLRWARLPWGMATVAVGIKPAIG